MVKVVFLDRKWRPSLNMAAILNFWLARGFFENMGSVHAKFGACITI